MEIKRQEQLILSEGVQNRFTEEREDFEALNCPLRAAILPSSLPSLL